MCRLLLGCVGGCAGAHAWTHAGWVGDTLWRLDVPWSLTPCLPHPPSCSPHSPTLLSPCSRLKRGLWGWRLRLLLSGPLTRRVVHSGGLQGLELLEVHVPADLWRDRDRRRRGQTGEGHVANESILSFYSLSSTADPSIRAGHVVAAGGGGVEQTDWSRAAERVTWHFVLLWLVQLPAVFLLLLVS